MGVVEIMASIGGGDHKDHRDGGVEIAEAVLVVVVILGKMTQVSNAREKNEACVLVVP